jgi:hypothetical protein
MKGRGSERKDLKSALDEESLEAEESDVFSSQA